LKIYQHQHSGACLAVVSETVLTLGGGSPPGKTGGSLLRVCKYVLPVGTDAGGDFLVDLNTALSEEQRARDPDKTFEYLGFAPITEGLTDDFRQSCSAFQLDWPAPAPRVSPALQQTLVGLVRSGKFADLLLQEGANRQSFLGQICFLEKAAVMDVFGRRPKDSGPIRDLVDFGQELRSCLE
jgi:hypothetical protein